MDPNLVEEARKLEKLLAEAAGPEDPTGRRLIHKAWQHAKAVIECLVWTPPPELEPSPVADLDPGSAPTDPQRDEKGQKQG